NRAPADDRRNPTWTVRSPGGGEHGVDTRTGCLRGTHCDSERIPGSQRLRTSGTRPSRVATAYAATVRRSYRRLQEIAMHSRWNIRAEMKEAVAAPGPRGNAT